MSVKTIFGVILILVSPILSRLGCMGTGVAVAAPAFALGIMLISSRNIGRNQQIYILDVSYDSRSYRSTAYNVLPAHAGGR